VASTVDSTVLTLSCRLVSNAVILKLSTLFYLRQRMLRIKLTEMKFVLLMVRLWLHTEGLSTVSDCSVPVQNWLYD